jgi:hypothetical protein
VDISTHIKELLYGHECVIIPGFGGFIGNYIPAHIDKAEGIIHPPVRKISFNRNLNHNDGLLIKHISTSSGMNYPDARNLVEEFVTELRRKLERGEKVVFDQIGSFVNNHEGNLQFEPDETVNYNLDSYGFEPVICHPIVEFGVKNHNITERARYKNYNLRRYLWRAAVLVPVAGTIVFVSLRTDLIKAKIETTTLNPLASTEIEHNRKAIDNIVDSALTVVLPPADSSNTLAAEITVSDASEIREPLTAKIVTPVSKNNYYLITGSFQSEENAGKQVSILQAEGFNPEIVIADNGYFRVCAMECPDIETAKTRKDSIAAKFPGTWISKKKN